MVAAAVALVVVLTGDDSAEPDPAPSVAKRAKQEPRMAEAAVRAGRLPKEAMQVFGPNGVLWSDFLGRPGSHDVVKEDTEADGKPDRNLRFDLDENVKIDPGERRFTESELFAAVLRVVPPSRPGPGEDPGTES